jgi:hypothetical protein
VEKREGRGARGRRRTIEREEPELQARRAPEKLRDTGGLHG